MVTETKEILYALPGAGDWDLKCPHCYQRLNEKNYQNIKLATCPLCKGVFKVNE